MKQAGGMDGHGCDASQGPHCEKEVRDLVLSFLARAEELKAAADLRNTPLYLFDPASLSASCRAFVGAFEERLPGFEAFFAMKCNNHPWMAAGVVAAGLGLDVSSGLELENALAAGCRRILFSGPGKTDDELGLALENRDAVTILLDSPGELDRLAGIVSFSGAPVRTGVRITTQEEGLWRKFGVGLAELETFMKKAARIPHVLLRGVQFHTSWNLTPDAHTGFIARLGLVLRNLDRGLTRDLEFIDIGGGYWPEEGEWLLDTESLSPGFLPGRRIVPAAPIDDFAREIARSLRENIFPVCPLTVYAEPGRWIANSAMHILLRVVDVKSRDIVIADAGTNIVGWERYESDYVPVINLSRPSAVERPCLIAGSLCTPHDVWGWSYFGDGIEPGDLLLLPNQGAYTWSLRQQFIKPTAEMVRLRQSRADSITWFSEAIRPGS
ncbi:MAG: decarboxylase [bacterium]|nr:decarboxylase [bacterium]